MTAFWKTRKLVISERRLKANNLRALNMTRGASKKIFSYPWVGLLLAAIFIPSIASATHFRGGSITWQSKAIDADGIKNDVEITVKTAWRRDNIGAVSLIKTPVDFTTTQTSESTIFINGTVSTADYALRTTVFQGKDLDPNVRYLVVFEGNARISDLQNNADGRWRIQTQIFLMNDNLAPKIDLPIVMEVPRLQSDGSTPLTDWTYNLSSTDPNADKLRYRLANLDELGAVSSTNAAGLSINPNTGVITWTNSGNRVAGLYSAGVVAEDVDENGNVKSKTHVDLILSLINQPQVDFTPPAEIPGTNNIVVEKGSSYSFSIAGTAINTQSLGTLQGALVEVTADNYTFTPGPPGVDWTPVVIPLPLKYAITVTHAPTIILA